MALAFKVVASDNKTVAKADEKPDPRSLVARMFTTFDAESGTVQTMSIEAINCTSGTAKDQGKTGFALANKIPVYLNYKAADNTFKGVTRGRDFVILGKRPGRKGQPGSSGVMVDIHELPELVENIQALYAALLTEVPNIRRSIGLEAFPKNYKAPGTAATTTPVSDSDLEDLDAALT